MPNKQNKTKRQSSIKLKINKFIKVLNSCRNNSFFFKLFAYMRIMLISDELLQLSNAYKIFQSLMILELLQLQLIYIFPTTVTLQSHPHFSVYAYCSQHGVYESSQQCRSFREIVFLKKEKSLHGNTGQQTLLCTMNYKH